MSAPPPNLLPVQREATPAYRAARAVGIPLLHLLFRITVQGRARIPAGNFVLVANHLNWLDSFLLLLAFHPEPRVHFLGDPSLLARRRLQWRVVRSVGGYIPVDRQRHGDARLYTHVLRCLERGGVVALYPEGNYGDREGALLPFKSGFAHFALEAGVPVVPVALSGTQELWLRKPVRVIIGPPIAPAGHTVDSLVALTRERLAGFLPAYVHPDGPRLLRKRLTHLF